MKKGTVYQHEALQFTQGLQSLMDKRKYYKTSKQFNKNNAMGTVRHICIISQTYFYKKKTVPYIQHRIISKVNLKSNNVLK